MTDLVLSDPGSITSEDEQSSDSDDDSSQNASLASSVTSLPATSLVATVSASEQEFQTEVRLSLERAFSESHSLENASVELKTLRMASNVPLRRVREAVVAGIVEKIALVEGAVPQRAEIKRWVDRWGDLINLIGGVDGVETVSILQVSTLVCIPMEFMTFHNIGSTTALPRRAFHYLGRYLQRFIKTMLSRRKTSETGTPNQKRRVRA